MNRDATGGYLGLELPAPRGEFYPDAHRFQSARAAFLALLRAHRPRAVWVPRYICDSMLEPLLVSGTRVIRYAIDDQFRVVSAAPAEGEWLLYVNYFGLCARSVDDVLSRFPAGQVVIDQSQAFYSRPRPCLATIYSPRKFFGVPDGGYLITTSPIPLPAEEDDQSMARATHLLKRIAHGAEAGYADFVAGEVGLRMQEPMRMSTLTARLLASVDYADVSSRRRANFAFLDGALGRMNRLRFDKSSDQTPLCYPFLGAPAGTRAALLRERIYSPCYWPEVIDDDGAPTFEKHLAETALFLPCDQRLSRRQLEHMVEVLLNHVERA